SPLPVLTSIAPDNGTQGTSVGVTLNGSNFQPGATISIGGSGVTATNVNVVSATQITATFAINSAASTGAHSVTVTTTAGSSGPQSFTVTAPAIGQPTLSSLSPNQASR